MEMGANSGSVLSRRNVLSLSIWYLYLHNFSAVFYSFREISTFAQLVRTCRAGIRQFGKLLTDFWMRTAIKRQLLFLAIAITIYALGFQFLPEHLESNGNLAASLPIYLAVFSYFVLLPALYWLLILKANQDSIWKLIFIFSLSCVCARYSFPKSIAEYFEFVAWIRHPIVGTLLLVELYLAITIVKGLWQARKLPGDPRIHVVRQYRNDEYKRTIALPFAYETATWYYAIPIFTVNHSKAMANLKLVSATRISLIGVSVSVLLLAILSYVWLVNWSEIAAFVVSSVILYGLVLVFENHRVARHFSIYIYDNRLIINNSFWGFMAVDLSEISSVKPVQSSKASDREQLVIGRGTMSNLVLHFAVAQTYFGTLGFLPEQVEKIVLQVDNSESLVTALK